MGIRKSERKRDPISSHPTFIALFFLEASQEGKLAICIQHIQAMKRGYGEKASATDSVTLPSNLAAMLRSRKKERSE